MNNSNVLTPLSDRMLESNKDKGVLDINCCDPLGRSALLMAIDNENLEIIELLLDNKVRMVLPGTGQIGINLLIHFNA